MKTALSILLSTLFFVQIINGQDNPVSPNFISEAVFFDVSGPLKDFPALTPEELVAMKEESKLKRNVKLKTRHYPFSSIAQPHGPDAVWQKEMGTLKTGKGPILSFNGQNSSSIPPDCNGDIGLNYYFQGVNATYSIYDKAGSTVVPSTAYNSLFAGVPGANNNDGDPIILYDDQADRWMAAEFSGAWSNPDYMLIAVSTSGDPTGTWNRWSFLMNGFPDYMKFGIWQDGYYMATNTYSGNDVYVFEREEMLAGSADPQMVGFNNPWRPSTIDGFHCIQPLDNDGIYSPAGSPGMFITINDDAIGGGNDELWIYELEVNWQTPSSSTFDRIQQLQVSAFDSNFGNSWNNVVQPGTNQKLDAIPGILMYRAQYKNFETSQHIICCHTVDVDATNHAGIRWYELTKNGSQWDVRQQGTYAPDEHSRWMGSIAMNDNHEIAIGYSISSSTEYPGIRYTGQSAAANAQANGILDITENVVWTGTHSQTNAERWGDYSLLTVDPSDNQTFWFTTQYMIGNGKKTRISAFDFTDILPPSAFAGSDTTICENVLFQTNPYAQYYSSVQWETSGDGMFQNPAVIDAKYLRGNQDIENGSVELTLNVIGFEAGQVASDMMTLTITREPEADAGNDTTIFSNTILGLNGQATDYLSVEWSTSGDGNFNDASILNAVYTPGSADISSGQVNLTLTAFAIGPCEDEDSDNLSVTIDQGTAISNQDFNEGLIRIYPNPTSGKIYVLIEDAKSEMPLVTVSDLAGNTLYERVTRIEEAKATISLDLSNLKSGIYLMEVKSDTFRKVEKIVVK